MSDDAKKAARPFDFEKHAGKGPASVEIDIAHSLANEIAKLLSQALKSRVIISARAVEQLQMNFAEWQRQQDPKIQHMWVKCDIPQGKQVSVVISLSFNFIDQLINVRGGGKAAESDCKQLFPSKLTDAGIMQGVDICINGLQKCGLIASKVPYRIIANEELAERISAFNAHENVACLKLAVTIEPRRSPLLLNITLPTGLFKQTRVASKPESKASWVDQLSKHLKRTMVALKVELGTAELTVHDLMQLGIGDIIILDRDASDPLPVYVEGQVKFLGLPGLAKNHRAIRIIKSVA